MNTLTPEQRVLRLAAPAIPEKIQVLDRANPRPNVRAPRAATFAVRRPRET